MDHIDRDYYRARISVEKAAARAAAHPLAADSHRRLAAEYADLLSAAGVRDAQFQPD